VYVPQCSHLTQVPAAARGQYRPGPAMVPRARAGASRRHPCRCTRMYVACMAAFTQSGMSSV